VFHDQQHFVFPDKHGAIWHPLYVRDQNEWRFHEIKTNGHPAAGSIFVSVFDSADQQHFVYTDSAGNVWDSSYRRGDDSWHFHQIDTDGHTPVGPIFVSAFFDQQHFVFRDGAGNIWDSFYEQAHDKWRFNQINTIDAVGNGHPATSDIFVSVFGDQQHFVYTDSARNVWDSFYRRGHGWDFLQIDTHGHTPVGGIFVSAFFDQHHFVYRDGTGLIWDSFYADADHKWHFQQINGCMFSTQDEYQDLSPDDAPCNAINKIVRGYLQAFDAMPQKNGQLAELWNSEDEANDGVEWFAKQSPPTIADGKVFVAEFPAKPEKDNWNASNTFGRLIMYSLLR
jgi:outer membrane protein assembly factor BamB